MSDGKKVLTMAEAAKAIGNLTGKTPSTASLWRWCCKGTRGRKLRSFLFGGCRVIPVDAIDEFFAVDELAKSAPSQPEKLQRPGRAKAQQILDAAGI